MRALCLAFSLTFIFTGGVSLSSCGTVDLEGLGENVTTEADAAPQTANFGEGTEVDSAEQTPPLGGGDDALEGGIGGGPQADDASGDEAQTDAEGEVPVDDAGPSDEGPNPTPSACVTAGAQCDDGDCCTGNAPSGSAWSRRRSTRTSSTAASRMKSFWLRTTFRQTSKRGAPSEPSDSREQRYTVEKDPWPMHPSTW